MTAKGDLDRRIGVVEMEGPGYFGLWTLEGKKWFGERARLVILAGLLLAGVDGAGGSLGT